MAFAKWLRLDTHRYDLINEEKEDETEPLPSLRTTVNNTWKTALHISIALFVVAASFSLGWLLHPNTSKGLLGSENDVLFRYNRTFGEPPSDSTNAAWESLFPKHGGFFVHPDIAPERSAFSVFHQLHCLDELRHGFYVLHDQVIAYADQANGKRALPEHSLGHIRHCIDLLRQSLMCNADLTVELKDEQLGGVTGFGTEHRCTDWQGLLDWIQPWEGKDAPPLVEVENHDHIVK